MWAVPVLELSSASAVYCISVIHSQYLQWKLENNKSTMQLNEDIVNAIIEPQIIDGICHCPF